MPIISNAGDSPEEAYFNTLPVSEIHYNAQKVWEEPAEGDPYWNNVVSLLHFDGDLVDEKGIFSWSQSNVDYPTDAVWERSLYLKNTKSSRVWATHNPMQLMEDKDFTIEMWLKIAPQTYDWPGILVKRKSNRDFSYSLGIDRANNLCQFIVPLQSGQNTGVGHVITYNVWQHHAIVRVEGSLNYYLDGVLVDSTSIPLNAQMKPTSHPLGIGQIDFPYSNHPFKGNIDELRITKGIARYTENFIPPTEPFPNF